MFCACHIPEITLDSNIVEDDFISLKKTKNKKWFNTKKLTYIQTSCLAPYIEGYTLYAQECGLKEIAHQNMKLILMKNYMTLVTWLFEPMRR